MKRYQKHPHLDCFCVVYTWNHFKARHVNWHFLEVSGFLPLLPWLQPEWRPTSVVLTTKSPGYRIWRKRLDIAAFLQGNSGSLKQSLSKQKHLPDWDEQDSHAFMAFESLGKGGQNLRCAPKPDLFPRPKMISCPQARSHARSPGWKCLYEGNVSKPNTLSLRQVCSAHQHQREALWVTPKLA